LLHHFTGVAQADTCGREPLFAADCGTDPLASRRCYTHKVPESVLMDFVLFASAVAPKGLPVILPALAGAGILIFLSQLFVPKT
jgi:hypothetical protein